MICLWCLGKDFEFLGVDCKPKIMENGVISITVERKFKCLLCDTINYKTSKEVIEK